MKRHIGRLFNKAENESFMGIKPSLLRQRMIEDMTVRGFSPGTQLRQMSDNP